MSEKAPTKKELREQIIVLQQKLEAASLSPPATPETPTALQKNGGIFSNIVINLPDPVAVMDTNLCLLFTNPALEHAFSPQGRPLIGKKCFEVYFGRDRACDQCPCLETLHTGRQAEAVIPHQDPEGKITGWFHHFSFPLKDQETGKLTGVVKYIRDISGQRQTEETLKTIQDRFHTLMDSLADGYYEVDLKGNLVFFNDALTVIFGYSREELLGMNNREYSDKENARKMYQAFNLVYQTGTPIRGLRFETITKQKTRRHLELSISLRRDEDGTPIGFRGIARDITDLMDFQKSLKAGEERYRTIIETIEDGYYEVDLTGNLLYFNDALARIHGMSRQEMARAKNRGYTDAENAAIIEREYEQVFITGQPARGVRYEINTYKNTRKTLEVSISLIKDSAGTPIGFRGITRDISDLIKIQNDLQASEERYRTIIETIEDGYGEVDLAGNFTFVNDVMCKIFEYSREELLGMNNRQYTDAENVKILYNAFSKVFRTGEPSRGIRYEMTTRTGGKKHLEVSVALFRDVSGNPVGFRGITRDITDLIRIQNDLKASEERYRTIIETIEDGYYEVDLAGNLTFFNEVMVGIHEYSREELLGMNNRHYTDAENAKILFQAFNRVYRTGEPSRGTQYEIITKDGGRKHLEASVSLIKDREGKPVGFRGIVRDISALVKTQKALKGSEERYRNIIETIEDGYYEVDLQGNLTFCNDAYCRITGYDHKELLGMNNRQRTDPENAKIAFQAFNQIYRTGKPDQNIHYEILTKNRERKSISTSASLIRDAAGKPIGFRGILRDISGLIQTQRALAASEERYRTIIEQIVDGYYEVDLTGKFTYVNDSMVRILGYPKSKLLEINNREYTFPEYHRVIYDTFNRIYQTGEPSSRVQYEIFTQRGERKFVETSASLIRDPAGKPVGFRGIVRDITELKQAQTALEASEERFRVAAESASDFLFEWDLQSGEIRWFSRTNEKLIELFGEIPARAAAFERHIHPEDLDHVNQAIRRHVRDREPYLEAYRLIGNNGQIFHVKTAGRALRDEKGWAYKWIGAINDITEQKISEERLRQNLFKLHKSMGGIIQAMALTVESKDPYTAGHQQRVSNLARTLAQEIGLSTEQVEAVRMAGVVHDLGKISVPAEILSKPGELNTLEFSLIKAHPQTSYDILKDIDFPWPVAQIVLQHHERIDGSGYPSGLKGKEIRIEAQVLMVADVVEAIASHRPYRPAYGVEAALEEIEKNKGILYNAVVVEACLRLFREKGFVFGEPFQHHSLE